MCFRKCSSKYGEILRIDIDQSSIYGSVTGNNSITVINFFVHPKIGGAMGNQYTHFLKRSFIQKVFYTFSGGQLFFLMLLIDTFLTPTL